MTDNPEKDLKDNKKKIGRNEPCHCGSGKKYKRCCINKDREEEYPQVLRDIELLNDPASNEYIDHVRTNKDALKNPDFWNALGTTIGSIGHHDKALHCFEKSKNHGGGGSALINIAVTLHSLGEHEKALEILKEVPDGQIRKEVITANILQDLGRHEEAISLYEKAIEIEPDFWLPYARLLGSLKTTQNPAHGYWLEKAIKSVPQYPWIAKEYCYFLLKENRLEELAEAEWIDNLKSSAGEVQIIGRSEDDPQLIIEAQLFRIAGLAAKSWNITYLQKAAAIMRNIDKNLNLCDVSKLFTRLAADIGNYEYLTLFYNHVCSHCRTNGIGIPSKIEYFTPLLELRAGNLQKSIELSEQALKCDPDNLYVLTAYWWVLDEVERTEEAIEVAEKLYKSCNETKELLYNLGIMCSKMGLLGKAKYYFNKGLERESQFWMALENLAFINLMECDFETAKSNWEKAQSIILRDRQYFDKDVILDATNDKEKTNKTLLENMNNKFNKLFNFARDNVGSHTYIQDLINMNEKNEPCIFMQTIISKELYTREDLISAIGHPGTPEYEEKYFQLKMEKRADYSVLFNKLKHLIPCWEELPDNAKYSLIEGERRIHDSTSIDHASEIVLFAKAVEIILKKKIFDEYKNKCQSYFGIEEQIESVLADKNQQAHNFVKYLQKGTYIELGAMHHALCLCSGKTAERQALIGGFRDFIKHELKIERLLSDEVLTKISELSKYRNPAAHSEIFNITTAQRIRDISLEVLCEFRG